MSDACPSCGHKIASTNVSVRNELPERKSEPINKKLIESLFDKSGSGVGPWPEVSGGGGAASVGNSELKSTVAVGWIGGTGVGDGVVVGKNGSSVGT